MDFINQWLESMSTVLADNLWLGMLISFAAGILTSFTPCSLSSIPLVIGYVSGYTDDKRKAFFYSLMFSLGMVAVFTALGVAAAFIGRLFLGIMMYWYLVLAIMMALMALQTWGVINILPQRCGYVKGKKGITGAVMLGALGAVFSSPCSTPVLIAILAVVSAGQSIIGGALMLLLYSAGHSVLLIIAGTSVGWVQEISKSKKFSKAGGIIKALMGFIMLLLSLYLVFTALR